MSPCALCPVGKTVARPFPFGRTMFALWVCKGHFQRMNRFISFLPYFLGEQVLYCLPLSVYLTIFKYFTLRVWTVSPCKNCLFAAMFSRCLPQMFTITLHFCKREPLNYYIFIDYSQWSLKGRFNGDAHLCMDIF